MIVKSYGVFFFFLRAGSGPVIHSVSLKLVIVKTIQRTIRMTRCQDSTLSYSDLLGAFSLGMIFCYPQKRLHFYTLRNFLFEYLNELHLNAVVFSYASVFM